MTRNVIARNRPWSAALAALLLAAFAGGCGSEPGGAAAGAVYPMFVDADGDGVNDYVEARGHDSGPALRMMPGPGGPGPGSGLRGTQGPGEMPRPGEVAPPGHPFADANGDGICDYAQNGSATWHGPGFGDEDGDGICDYWQAGSPRYGMNGGMMFRDSNRNGVNDYTDASSHAGLDHDFADRNGDGICDYAQIGTGLVWHGPGATDTNGDGMPDMWQTGMPGPGGGMGG